MTPDRLSHLASRAAVGEQNRDEQRECMVALHEAYSELDDVYQCECGPDYTALAAAASVAEDSNDLTRLMHTDRRYADIVQRMVALVIVDALRRIHERAEDQ